jgi:hypothetical protein
LLRLFPRRRVPAGEAALTAALRPWERQLGLETVERWLLRGVLAALVLGSLVLAIGWVTPWPESELQPYAAQLAVPVLGFALLVAVWPRRRARRAAELDTRLRFGDRLATAWAYRRADGSIVALQREDAITRLERRSPRSDLVWRPSRMEIGSLAAALLVAGLLVIVPSPMQRVLDQQAAEQLAVQRATDRLEALRQDAIAAPSLTPEQARWLDELLQQAQLELNRIRTQQDARAILARTQEQLTQQLGDPDAETREEALGAMSETLTAEPLSRALGEALQHEDAREASEALKALTAQADQLSDIQRQALSRALQRAANVGRGEPRSSAALREAARALGAGESSEAALSATEAALRDAIQAATAQASVRSTLQRLRELEGQLASAAGVEGDPSQLGTGDDTELGTAFTSALGTPVAVDPGGSGLLRDPSAERGRGAGTGAAEPGAGRQAVTAGDAAENVFVPGREGYGAADQDLTDQAFTIRGQPRPYRDVLSQYAQSGRDYVDRPDVSPAVRELVKQYFQQLQEGQ